MRFFGLPYPARAFGKGYPYTSAGDPHLTRAFAGISVHSCRPPRPARAFSGRLPMHFCRQPPPRPRFHGDTRALLPATPTPPAPSALLPRPLLGAGSVRGDIR